MFKDSSSKYLTLLALAGSLAAGSALAQPAAAADAKTPAKTADLFPDKLVAKGQGVEVKRSALDEEAIRVKSQMAANNQSIPPEQASLLDKQVLQQLIQLQLIKAKATDADRVNAKKEAEKLFEEAKKSLGSEESLNLRLKAQGITRDELLAKWNDGELAKAVLIRELKINISDADAKKFYDDNPSQFEEPEMVRASHILLSTRDKDGKELSDAQKAEKRKTAEDLLKRARGGEDFAKLAKQYSEDPGSKDNGGEYKFPRGQMVKEFETTAFSLKTNEVSDIVTTQFGYHIIKLSEKIPAKKHDFAEVEPKIKDYLTQVAIRKQAPEYLDKLRQDAKVEILDDSLKPSETASAAGATPVQPAPKPVK